MTHEEMYRFYPYSNRYPGYFQQESKRLASALGFSAEIQHVGSSSVPGLGGKRIIDIAVGVTSAQIELAKSAIVEAGFEFRKHASTEQRLFFRAERAEGGVEHRVHIHLVDVDEDQWAILICFRDYMRAHADAADQYARVKERAASVAEGNGTAYMELKQGFIAEELEKARRWCHNRSALP